MLTALIGALGDILRAAVVALERFALLLERTPLGPFWPVAFVVLFQALAFVVSQRSELAGADQRAGQVQQCGEEVGVALVADGQAPVGQQPGQRSLDLPAMTAQQLTGLDATAGDPWADPSSA